MTARSGGSLAVALLLPLGVGALGGVATFEAVRSWYPSLARPSFAPPSSVFGPVWTTLYIMMGAASWLVWRAGSDRPDVRTALKLYGGQLALNLAWSWLFFGLRQPLLGLIDIVLLLTLIAITAFRFAQVSRVAGLLMSPYLAWVTFATALNAGFWWLNR